MNANDTKTLPFMDFVEHADAILKKGLLIRKDEVIPPLSQSHLFHLGDDEKITEIARELRDDLMKDITHRVPFPFADTTMVSSIPGTGWILDRVFDLGLADFKVPDNAYLDTRDPGVPEEKAQTLLKELLHRDKAQFFNVVRVEEGVNFPVMWTIAYYGAIADVFSFTALDEHEFIYGYEATAKNPTYGNMQELTHSSPVPHHRRGHWRRVAERFVNAKLRGEHLWVRPAYVGQTRFEDAKAIYNVMMDWKKPE